MKTSSRQVILPSFITYFDFILKLCWVVKYFRIGAVLVNLFGGQMGVLGPLCLQTKGEYQQFRQIDQNGEFKEFD